LLTHAVARPPKKDDLGHEAHYYLELLRRLGLVEQYAPVNRIELPASEAARRAARARFRELFEESFSSAAGFTLSAGLVVGVSPGATFGTAKRWPAGRFAEFVSRLQKEYGATCVFFGSPEERALADEVLALAGVPAISTAGRTSLSEFMQLIQGCDLFVTNDTGTMHVAAGLGVPTVAIFGPTNEKETRPLGSSVELVTGQAYCRPCKLRHCPIDHRCMTSVSVDRVLRTGLSLLTESGRIPRVPTSNPVVVEGGPRQ
jgi:heptosyltransferase-2